MRLEQAAKRLDVIVAAELQDGILPGVSVAWVVDGQLVHAAGYGQADAARQIPATADTIYRAGSISKLFTAVAAMQQVEQGKLSLDAPIQQALPSFHIAMPFADPTPITIRQLLCHRSGMIRESPVGGYLDASQPTIAATVASVAQCALVNPPNTKTRYSNVGPTIVGHAVERCSGLDYATYQQKHVLGPLDMQSSAWTMNDTLRPRLATGRMRIARGDGSYLFEPAPEFELGTIPAGNLYTSARDLAKFAAFMMGRGAGAEGLQPLVTKETLARMYEPQLIDSPTGFGLGFSIGKFREHRTAQHSGAVYGFSTSLVVLPEANLGVVVLSNADIAQGPVKRLVDASLNLLLEATRQEAVPAAVQYVVPSAKELAAIEGVYESVSYWARLSVKDQQLTAEFSGQPIQLKCTAPLKYLAFGRIMNESPFEFDRAADGTITGFSAAGQKFQRIAKGRESAEPVLGSQFAGMYGERFIPLVIAQRYGRLYATVENEYDYCLTPLNRVTFNLSPGMYADEQVVFQLDQQGRAWSVIMANMLLPRRD